MRQMHFLNQILMAIFVNLACCACSSDLLSEVEPTNQASRHSIKMKFVGNIVEFDQQDSSKEKLRTRATSSWSEGDKIYINFYNGSTIIPGEAIYSDADGWTISYDGNIGTGKNLKCEARYFVNATSSSSSLVSLNSNSEIYEDLNATYTNNNDSLTVAATLSPKTGRIRFTGNSGEKIHTTGITVYTAFYPGTNSFSISNAMITSIVASSGSTPYIYGYFTDNERNLGLVGSDYAFTRTGTNDMLKTGESGYMSIPSESSHRNWRSGLYVKANGVEFKMIPIAGYSGGFFMMAETETTEALYNSVTGTASSSQLPVDQVAYSAVTSFIEKLNSQTKLTFALPSAEQWKYAAKGGNKSQNFTYCGSNTPDDVAWYSANSSSKQEVKKKAPNELGIYDMSGNVGEFVSDNDELCPYIYGGAYCTGVSYIYKSSRVVSYDISDTGYFFSNCFLTSSYCYSKGVGFRLVLTFK